MTNLSMYIHICWFIVIVARSYSKRPSLFHCLCLSLFYDYFLHCNCLWSARAMGLPCTTFFLMWSFRSPEEAIIFHQLIPRDTGSGRVVCLCAYLSFFFFPRFTPVISLDKSVTSIVTLSPYSASHVPVQRHFLFLSLSLDFCRLSLSLSFSLLKWEANNLFVPISQLSASWIFSFSLLISSLFLSAWSSCFSCSAHHFRPHVSSTHRRSRRLASLAFTSTFHCAGWFACTLCWCFHSHTHIHPLKHLYSFSICYFFFSSALALYSRHVDSMILLNRVHLASFHCEHRWMVKSYDLFSCQLVKHIQWSQWKGESMSLSPFVNCHFLHHCCVCVLRNSEQMSATGISF